MWLLHLNTSFWILRGMLWNMQLRDKAFLINKYRYLLHFRKNLVCADFDLWSYQADLQEKVHSFLSMSGYIFILFKLLSKRKKKASGRVSPDQQELECGQVLAESIQPFIHPREMCWNPPLFSGLLRLYLSSLSISGHCTLEKAVGEREKCRED